MTNTRCCFILLTLLVVLVSSSTGQYKDTYNLLTSCSELTHCYYQTGVIISDEAQQVTLYVGISFSFTGLTILIVTHLAFKYVLTCCNCNGVPHYITYVNRNFVPWQK